MIHHGRGTQGNVASRRVSGLLTPGIVSLFLALAGCGSGSSSGDGGATLASNSTVSPSPTAGVIADDIDTTVITITVLDGSGNPVAGQTVEIAVSGSGNTIIQPAGPTDAAGVATATVSSTTAELKTIIVTVDPLGTPIVLDAMPTVDFIPFALAFGQLPATQEQQDTVFSYFTVECQDSLGNVFTADNSSEITIALETGFGTLGGTLTKTVVSGVTTFADATYDTVESITLQVTSVPTATTVTSGAIDVQAGPAPDLVIAKGSVDDLGAEADGHSRLPAVSADGRYVAFVSKATNLVAGDTNASDDVFVHDRLTGSIERVSVDDLGAEADDKSNGVTISADGRYAAFTSAATNLVPGDTNAKDDVFVYDRQTDTIERVSVDDLGNEADDNCQNPAISPDGRFVAFETMATNLVAGDTNAARDVFVYDRLTGTIERVSVDDLGNEGDQKSKRPAISADGRYVAFDSKATNLVPGDTNVAEDVFVYDRQTDTIERVSVDDLGSEGDSKSRTPSISSDGRFVAFQSLATNLVAGDTNGSEDVFVYDRMTGTIERASVDDLGNEADDKSQLASLSSDGNLVAFKSRATNLVAGDTNAKDDVFVHNRPTGVTIRVSVDELGAEADRDSFRLSLTDDGRYAAFESAATNLVAGDTNTKRDIFLAPVSFP